eukprot:Phypoly_transcript_22404.p1 GENE.Phypoly_transcript_22404~~Phypoly_transcript_22404.p1  ORF type:complete len:121 (-),score=4.02 Phypoly_transcript_22404:148-510(-)
MVVLHLHPMVSGELSNLICINDCTKILQVDHFYLFHSVFCNFILFYFFIVRSEWNSFFLHSFFKRPTSPHTSLHMPQCSKNEHVQFFLHFCLFGFGFFVMLVVKPFTKLYFFGLHMAGII